MIVSQLQVYNFRRFKSIDGKPGLSITFHEGQNALIGENDSGKTAIIGLCYSLFRWKGDVYLLQQCGSQHGDLKPEAVESSDLCQMFLTAFFCAWK